MLNAGGIGRIAEQSAGSEASPTEASPIPVGIGGIAEQSAGSEASPKRSVANLNGA
jgi:phage-related protein